MELTDTIIPGALLLGLFSAIAVVKNGAIKHHFFNFHSLSQLQLLIIVCVCVAGVFKEEKHQTVQAFGHNGSFWTVRSCPNYLNTARPSRKD